MWSIRQTETGWEVLQDGTRFGDEHESYDLALAVIAQQVEAFLADAADNADPNNNPDDGLLPEVWEDAGGIFYSEQIPDGRDFTNCQWSWRDPAVSLLPLMLQTTTDIGHFGAVLAGFMAEISETGGTGHASGRFYATDNGRAARDLLLDGRHFGVSVDPGAIEVEFICTEEDDDGWCIDGDMNFLAYQVIGLTMTPFPGFPAAAIQLQGAGASSATGDTAQAATRPAAAELGTTEPTAALAAAASTRIEVPMRPNRAWLEIPEPQPGMTGMLDVYGMPAEELLIEQRDGGLAVPLTITDEGRVFGHLARWGQRHVAYLNENVTPPDSLAAYAHFHVGSVVTDDGSRVAAGTAVFGCEHAPFRNPDGSYTTAAQARDFYAHSGASWSQLRVSSGEFGPWVSGALMPGLSELQLRILRSLVLSGDWRDIGEGLELIGVLAVNVPGFPIAREALAASGMTTVPTPTTRGLVVDRRAVAVVAAGTVHRCARCQERAALAASGGMPARTADGDPVVERLDRIEATVGKLERRTRHLVVAERDHLATRLRREPA